jgi:hypothetical protein
LLASGVNTHADLCCCHWEAQVLTLMTNSLARTAGSEKITWVRHLHRRNSSSRSKADIHQCTVGRASRKHSAAAVSAGDQLLGAGNPGAARHPHCAKRQAAQGITEEVTRTDTLHANTAETASSGTGQNRGAGNPQRSKTLHSICACN